MIPGMETSAETHDNERIVSATAGMETEQLDSSEASEEAAKESTSRTRENVVR